MNTNRASNSLDPDQERHFVGPDPVQNCLQGYQQMTRVAASMEESIIALYTFFFKTKPPFENGVDPDKLSSDFLLT